MVSKSIMQRAHTRMRERERERAALDTEGRSRQAGTTERAQKGAQQLRSERDAGRFIGKLRSLLGCWPGGSAAQALESLLLVLGQQAPLGRDGLEVLRMGELGVRGLGLG